MVVHGRFHAFDLVRALVEKGHQITLLTNYPRWAVKRFGVSYADVRSFWLHGLVGRALQLLARIGVHYPERLLHPWFSRWALTQLRGEKWDVVHCRSGVAREVYQGSCFTSSFKLLLRGSAHIRTQSRILQQEEERTGVSLERPSSWVIAREESEYQLCDQVLVLSSFAQRTFVEEGLSDKAKSIPLGVEVRDFRPSPEVIAARCRRILSGAPLRVLYVGALSLQKGLWDLMALMRSPGRDKYCFRLVGSVAPESQRFLKQLRQLAELVPKQSQHELSKWYSWGDLFIFPTLHDGFALVLAQAAGSALPVLTTTNCSGPDFIQEGKTGWILPIRNPKAFVDRLEWCSGHREELAAMVRYLYQYYKPRSWMDVAEDFEALCRSRLG